MKKLLSIGATFFLVLIPLMVNAQSEQNKPGPPPIDQSLVREGSFAMKLAETLKTEPVKSEAEAESRLASMGIAPRNGWIADYPLTPDIIGEVRNAIGVALDSGKIAMNKDEALMAVQVLIDNEWRLVVASDKEQARQYGEYPPAVYEGDEPYYYPGLYYYPYYDPYLYYYGGYYYLGGLGGRGFLEVVAEVVAEVAEATGKLKEKVFEEESMWAFFFCPIFFSSNPDFHTLL